ncbi:outer membrane biogenesis protein BamB [Stieleria maiorica]|uniref:Outer membrane biogenesis protein BamB n=1 Tax=Stieleria maiorica TaxID=2795974 RepID=A0A5B9MT95_9BACT|nr:PQQ-binding-like beta-propeller repeat protein [Stieleria maiorica]QEG02288.1 outer membrane biogenesis protein BamB [Stieleria maiorica]
MSRFRVVFFSAAFFGFVCLCQVLICGGEATAGDWSQFRGTNVDGVASTGDYPTEWSATENVRWSVALPQPGNGSPIVVDGNVFVCSVEDPKGLARSLLCFDADNGRQRWSRTVTLAEEMPTHKTNPYAGGTPASDGKRVVVWHATAGLHAYNMNGDPLWSRDLGEFRHMWGYGSSPIIVGDRVILNSGPGKQVFVAAFDVESGETLWRHDEPVAGDGERNAEGKYMGTWSTPVPIQRDGRPLVVVAMHERILALDVQTGDVEWFFRVKSDRGDLAYSSPIIEGNLCVFNAGFKGPTMAFEMKGQGDITGQQVWRIENNPQSIGTGVIRNGFVYRLGAGPNLIECLDLKSGKTQWQQRNKAAFWGSIAVADQTAYATDQSGNTIVFRLSPDEFVPIAQNPLDDSSNATPALAAGSIYLRTNQKLWCVE